MISQVKTLLQLDNLAEVKDIDSPAAYALHRRIIFGKPFLQSIYKFYFCEMLKDFETPASKKIVEIGAGAYNSSEVSANVITSDIIKNDFVKMAVDAHNMPFHNGELDGLILLETLHHLKKPAVFFQEAQRTLKVGGLLVMVEPYFSRWGDFVYRRLHHEPVLDVDGWDIPDDSSGRLSGANLKTPYNIFIRDRDLFLKRFTYLRIDRITRHTCFNYLLSGGLSYKCLVPRGVGPFVWGLETALRPLYRLLATSMTVVVRKV